MLHMRIILIIICGMNNPRPINCPLCTSTQTPVGVVRAKALLGSRSVLVIEHVGERYQLRLTKNGKLILTK